MRDLATACFVAGAENVLLFGPPGVGKTHVAVALGRAVVEADHSALFVTATSLLATLAKAQQEGKLANQIAFYAKPKLLIVDELGYLPLEKRPANLFFQFVSRRYERGSMLITANQTIAQWGHVFGDKMTACGVLHHSHTRSFRATATASSRSSEPGSSAHPGPTTVHLGGGVSRVVAAHAAGIVHAISSRGTCPSIGGTVFW